MGSPKYGGENSYGGSSHEGLNAPHVRNPYILGENESKISLKLAEGCAPNKLRSWALPSGQCLLRGLWGGFPFGIFKVGSRS